MWGKLPEYATAHTRTHEMLSRSSRTAKRFRAPSLVTREKTNIWSVLILLMRGGAEAKYASWRLFVKHACVGVLEVRWKPGGRHHSSPRSGSWTPLISSFILKPPSLYGPYCRCADVRSATRTATARWSRTKSEGIYRQFTVQLSGLLFFFFSLPTVKWFLTVLIFT